MEYRCSSSSSASAASTGPGLGLAVQEERRDFPLQAASQPGWGWGYSSQAQTFLLPPPWTIGTVPGPTRSSSVPDGSQPCLGLTQCLSPPERDGGESIIPRACRNASVPGISPPRLPQPYSFHGEIFSPAVRALEVQHPRGFPAGRQLRLSKEYSRSCFSTQGRSERSPLTFTGTFACSWPADSCRCGTTDVRGLSAPLLHRNI